MTDVAIHSLPLLEPRIQRSGIYFLFLQGRLVYVGQSVDIDMRSKSHISGKEFDEIRYLLTPIVELTTVESYYINKYKPFYNKGTGRWTENSYEIDGELYFICLGKERLLAMRDGDNLFLKDNKLGYIQKGYMVINHSRHYARAEQGDFYYLDEGKVKRPRWRESNNHVYIDELVAQANKKGHKLSSILYKYLECDLVFCVSDIRHIAKLCKYSEHWVEKKCEEYGIDSDHHTIVLQEREVIESKL